MQWYVSNVSIVFYCSMLLYYLFWMFKGFILHFYIIFGTTLLTGGPTQITVFCLFQCFAEKEYQMKSKRNETFRNVIFSTNVIQETWSGSQETIEEATRQGRAQGGRRTPLPRGLLDCFLTPTPSLLDHVCWENHVPEGFIPFGLRLIFFFCETLK